jgi:hypothetical protein
MREQSRTSLEDGQGQHCDDRSLEEDSGVDVMLLIEEWKCIQHRGVQYPVTSVGWEKLELSLQHESHQNPPPCPFCPTLLYSTLNGRQCWAPHHHRPVSSLGRSIETSIGRPAFPCLSIISTLPTTNPCTVRIVIIVMR